MIETLADRLQSFPIVLPNNPLKWLNCYVIRGERNLLLDTGFRMPACREALLAGMRELELTPDNTDVFLTHFHSDHIGGAAMLDQMGFLLIMGRTDYTFFCIDPLERLRRVLDLMRAGGMPEDQLQEVYREKGPSRFAPGPFHADTVEDGDILDYGSFRLQCVETPGHTQGHMCLWDREHSRLFLGDHILFDISPNICVWPEGGDALGSYLLSLDRICRFPAESAFPAHRNRSVLTVAERAAQLKQHHARRMQEMLTIIAEQPGICAYEIARQMRWRIRACSWEEFPLAQRYFAMNEALAHLEHMLREGMLRRLPGAGGICAYEICAGCESGGPEMARNRIFG